MRLEDLRAISRWEDPGRKWSAFPDLEGSYPAITVPHVATEPDMSNDRVMRLVSRREVLEALGAERKWVCWALNGRRCTGPWPEGPVPRTHGGCGYVWVVDDAT